MARQPKAGQVGERVNEKKGTRSAAAKLRREVGSGETIAKPPSDREADFNRAPKSKLKGASKQMAESMSEKAA